MTTIGGEMERSEPNRQIYPPKWRMTSMGWDGLATLVLALLVMVGSGGLSLLWCLARVHRVARDSPAEVSGGGTVLVLGKCLRRGQATADFVVRLDRARRLLGQPAGTARRILILGGHTSPAPWSEAEAGRAWLAARGVDPARILTEDGSRHTLENLHAARRMLAGQPGAAVLVTSRFHLARSRIMAEGLGLAVTLCAAEERLSYRPAMLGLLLAEAAFVNWYYCGRTFARLIRNRHMLGRIQ